MMLPILSPEPIEAILPTRIYNGYVGPRIQPYYNPRLRSCCAMYFTCRINPIALHPDSPISEMLRPLSSRIDSLDCRIGHG